jgi:hypothetical protein
MDTDLQDSLHRRLVRVAERSPEFSLQVSDITSTARRFESRRRAANIAVMAAMAVGMGFGASSLREVTSEEARGAAGAESPIVLAEQASQISKFVQRSDAITLILSDGQQMTFAIQGAPFYDGYRQHTCIHLDGPTSLQDATVCRTQSSDRELPLLPEPELGGFNTVRYWTDLPPTASKVEFLAPDGSMVWQRPIAGIAAVPINASSVYETFVAYDVNGAEVARTTWSSTHLVSSSGIDVDHQVSHFSSLAEPTDYGTINVEAVADLTYEQAIAGESFANDTMVQCSAGREGAWLTCIQSTDDSVRAYYSASSKALAVETP